MKNSLQHNIQNEASIFDEVRDGFLYVAENAQHVKINHDKLAVFADQLPDNPPENLLDEAHHFIGNDKEDTASYILTLDSINFGSGYAPYMCDEGWVMIKNSIYYTVSTRLKEYFEMHGVMSAEDLCKVKPEDIARMLQLNFEGIKSYEFATYCAQSMNELGHILRKSFDGSFMNFVNAAQGRASNIVRNLVDMRLFNDTHDYRGRKIPILKRAQITAADLHLAFERLGVKLFNDIDQLTMFADNAVPHVLRLDGVLEYSDELAARIDAGEEIVSGSPEEIEIRACAGHAVELIARHKNMMAMSVDHLLWHRGSEDSRYKQSPSHRTLSWFY